MDGILEDASDLLPLPLRREPRPVKALASASPLIGRLAGEGRRRPNPRSLNRRSTSATMVCSSASGGTGIGTRPLVPTLWDSTIEQMFPNPPRRLHRLDLLFPFHR